MNEIIIAIILGIVEGLTEFLPVSSTGHLILAQNWLDFTGEKANAFAVFIQLGAIFAVVGYFRQRIWRTIMAILGKPTAGNPHGLIPEEARRFFLSVVLAFIPAAVLGLFFEEIIETILFKPQPVAIALLAGGIAILLIEKFRPATKTSTAESITLSQAWWIGLAQCAALIPGVSRSASTIMGGLLAGLSHAAAAEFSFFLSIPTLGAASLYKLFDVVPLLSADDAVVFAVGFFVSLVVAWIVIAGFMAFIKRHSFKAFAWYRIVFGLAILLMIWFGVELRVGN
jgi:undecaprenyl-diphosphatase